MKILITGGAGFIGHHVVEHLLKTTDHSVVLLDRLDTSGNLNRLAEIGCWDQHKNRVRFVFHDLRAPLNDQVAAKIGPVDATIHMAAATHVDRSIDDPVSFVWDNVLGTAHILDFARNHCSGDFLFFGTDEIFGPAPPGVAYKEWDRYNSGNPYAATKAGAEELCLAYRNTYKLPVKIVHCMNVFGERQHPEKFIPGTLRKVLLGQTVTIHADETCTISGSRFYIHARNVASAVCHVMEYGTVGEKYNIVGEREVSNLEMAQLIAENVGGELHYEMVDFHSSRPGHDLRYALDGSKLAELGWKCPVYFEESLARMVRWTLDNRQWL